MTPENTQPPSMMRVTWPWSIGWGIAVILGLLLGWNIYAQQQREVYYETETEFSRLLISEKEAALKQGASDTEGIRQELTKAEEIVKFLESPKTVSVSMIAGTSTPLAAGKLFWNKQANKGRFIAFELPIPPEEKHYQLWAVQKTGTVHVGTFDLPQETGVVTLKAVPNPIEPVLFFMVTLEPTGEPTQPIGELILKGIVTLRP